jgi:ABC-type dipeptide/oligopeptide/nickel transport system permease subunit
MPELETAAAVAGEESVSGSLLEMLRRNKVAAVSLVVIVIIMAASAAAPLYMPYNPNKPSLKERFAPPSAAHWLGCDDLGRDQLTRLVYGARISILIGLIPTSLSMLIGTALGLVSGYAGGRTDFWIMRAADVVLAFP